MKRIQLIVLLFYWASISAICQENDINPYIDSLFSKVNELKYKDPSKALAILDTIQESVSIHNPEARKAKIYLKRWSIYEYQKDSIKSKLYQDSIKKIYLTNDLDDTYYYYLYTKGVNWHKKSMLDSANYYYQQIYEKVDTSIIDFFELKVHTITNMASVQRMLANYDAAVNLLEEGLDIAENYNGIVDSTVKNARLSGLYNGLGLIYRRTKEFDKSIKMYEKAEACMDSLNPRRYTASLNIVNSLMYLKRLDEAMEKSDEIYPHLNLLNVKKRFNFYSDRARIAIHSDQLGIAKSSIKSAREIQQDHDGINPQGILLTEGEYFYAINNFSKAKALFEEYLSSEPDRNRNSKITALKWILKCDLALKNPQGLKTLSLYDSLVDLNYENNLASGIQEWEVKYKTLEKEQELSELKQKNEIQSLRLFRNRFAMIFLALITLLSGIASFFYRKFLNEEKEINKFLDYQSQELALQNQNLQNKVGSWEAIKEGFYAIPGRENRKIKLADILYFASDGNEVIIYTKQKKYRAWLRLKDLAQDLPSDHFVRTHRSYIINIHEANFENNKYLLMSNGDKVALSKTYNNNVSIKMA